MLKKKKNLIILSALIIIVIILGLLFLLKQTNHNKTPHEFVKVTYLPLYKSWSSSDIKGDLLTTINLAFGTINKDFKVTINPVDNLNLEKELKDLKQKYPHLKINLSIGGWGADGFSDMASTKENRSIFIESVIYYLELYNLDGIDIDWEYPTKSESGTTKTNEKDTTNFVSLMKEINEKFTELEKNNNKKYYSSFACPVHDWSVNVFAVKKVNKYVDYIYIMGYDYNGQWSTTTGHHSNLYNNKKSIVQENTYDGVKSYLKACPAQKLVIGVPAYGYAWKGVNPQNDGLFNPVTSSISPDEMNLVYNNIKDNFINKNEYKRYWDDKSKSAYLYNGDIFITYEDTEAIVNKANFVKNKNLGGLMYWEYTQDTSYEIATTISNELSKKS